MRYFVIAFMIALLPLRGWVGDAMATEMLNAPLAHHESEITNAAIDDGTTRATDTSDNNSSTRPAPSAHAACADHEDGPQEASSGMDTHGSNCTLCQTCHTVALSAFTVDLMAMPHPHALPSSALPRFASAERALSIKPPIS